MSAPGDLPEAFRDFFTGLEEQRDSPGPADAFHRCFGCGPAHPSGLRVRCFKTAEGVVAPLVRDHGRYVDVEGSLEEFYARVMRVVRAGEGFGTSRNRQRSSGRSRIST